MLTDTSRYFFENVFSFISTKKIGIIKLKACMHIITQNIINSAIKSTNTDIIENIMFIHTNIIDTFAYSILKYV